MLLARACVTCAGAERCKALRIVYVFLGNHLLEKKSPNSQKRNDDDIDEKNDENDAKQRWRRELELSLPLLSIFVFCE